MVLAVGNSCHVVGMMHYAHGSIVEYVMGPRNFDLLGIA